MFCQEDIAFPSKHGMIAGISLLACGVITWWKLCCRSGEEKSEKVYADKSFVLEHLKALVSVFRQLERLTICVSFVAYPIGDYLLAVDGNM